VLQLFETSSLSIVKVPVTWTEKYPIHYYLVSLILSNKWVTRFASSDRVRMHKVDGKEIWRYSLSCRGFWEFARQLFHFQDMEAFVLQRRLVAYFLFNLVAFWNPSPKWYFECQEAADGPRSNPTMIAVTFDQLKMFKATWNILLIYSCS
jgi:hypothetical protein